MWQLRRNSDPVLCRITCGGTLINNAAPIVCHSTDEIWGVVDLLFGVGARQQDRSFTISQIDTPPNGYWDGHLAPGYIVSVVDPDTCVGCPICAPALPPAPEVVGAHKFLAKVAATLTQKNAQYGRSAALPMRVFSRASIVEQIKVRIDDKLSRLARGTNIVDNEDVLLDLTGYLALLAALRENESPGG